MLNADAGAVAGGGGPKGPWPPQKTRKNKFFLKNIFPIYEFGPFSKNSGRNPPSFPIFRVPYPGPPGAWPGPF